jgi:hypothetical protein
LFRFDIQIAIILPRQVRDKHRQSTQKLKKEWRFIAGVDAFLSGRVSAAFPMFVPSLSW